MGIETKLDETEIILPEFVYFNLPVKYTSLIVTAPSRVVEIPENACIEPDVSQLSIKMKNNGQYGMKPEIKNTDLLEKVKNSLCKLTYEFFKNSDEEKLNQMSRNRFVELLKKINLPEYNSILESRIQTVLGRENTLFMRDFDVKMTIEGAHYKGEYYEFEEFTSLRHTVEKDLESFYLLTAVGKGDYLYRAVQQQEWQQIIQDNSYLVRVETNFESEVGPQVKDYANDPSYAGKIIRVKVEGPFFRNAGFSVPRITSVVPHFANTVEVLEGNKWININDFISSSDIGETGEMV